MIGYHLTIHNSITFTVVMQARIHDLLGPWEKTINYVRNDFIETFLERNNVITSYNVLKFTRSLRSYDKNSCTKS